MIPNGPGWDSPGDGLGEMLSWFIPWMFVTVAVFGLIVVALMWKRLAAARHADRSWPRTSAHVLGVEERVYHDQDARLRRHRVARYRYRLPDGQEHIAEADVPGGSQLHPGSTTDIVYDPADPTRSLIPGTVTTGALVLFGAMTVFVLGVMAAAGHFLFTFAAGAP